MTTVTEDAAVVGDVRRVVKENRDELIDVREIFESDSWIAGGPMAGRAAFGPDGMIYLTVNDHVEHDGRDNGNASKLAQELDNDIGKVLRIRDDGGIPADNPFVGREGANPQIFTYGQRNVTDFAWHPDTGELWTAEIAPMGGDDRVAQQAGDGHRTDAARNRSDGARHLCRFIICNVAEQLAGPVRLFDALLADVDDRGSRLQPAAADQLGTADGSHDDIAAAHGFRQVLRP